MRSQFKFKLPYPKSQLAWATMKFWQDGNNFLPITKKLEDCTFDNEYELCVSLTAAETMKFSDKMKAKAQLAAQLTAEFGGAKFGSHQQLVTVYPMLDDLIVGDPSDDASAEGEWFILDGGAINT